MSVLSKKNDCINHWDVYKLTNPSNQVYIGKTTNLKKRLSNYKYLCGRVEKQRLLYESLLKYGIDSHTVEVIDSFDSNILYAHGKERFWVLGNMSNSNKYPEANGLNLADGGQGSNGMRLSEERKVQVGDLNRGKSMHENARKSLDEYYRNNPHPAYWKGKEIPQETREKMSAFKKGKPIEHLIGFKMTDIQIAKMSERNKGITSKTKGIKYSTERKDKLALTRNILPQAVLVYDKNTKELLGDFKSANQAAKLIGLGRGTISSRFKKGVYEYTFLNFIIKKK